MHLMAISPDARRGWSVVAGLFVMLMTSAGLGFYGLGVYLSTLSRIRGFSVSGMSGATAVFFVTSGIAGVGIAKLLRFIDPRPIVISGAMIAATSLVVLGRVQALWQVYAVYALFGVGYACTALVVSTTIVARWFHQKRASALSIASTGLSVGGIVLTPIARHWLAVETLPHATARIGILYLVVVVPVAVLFLRPEPSEFGLGPDGTVLNELERANGSPLSAAVGMPYQTAIASQSFRVITFAFLLALGAQVGGIAQLVKLAEERITDLNRAGQVVSVLAACSVAGRLLGGVLLSRTGTRRFALVMLLTQSLSIGTLAFASGTAAVFTAAVCFGLAVGNILLLHPLLLAEAFGVADYPRIYGRSQFFTTLGVAFGPFLFGWLRDNAGGYRTSYLVGASLSLVATFAFWKFPASELAERNAVV